MLLNPLQRDKTDLFLMKPEFNRSALRDTPLPQPGTPVAILYADEKTYNML